MDVVDINVPLLLHKLLLHVVHLLLHEQKGEKSMLLAPSPLVPSPTILANGTRVVGASAVGGGISLHRSTISSDGTADNFLFLAIVEGTTVVLKNSSPVGIEFIAEEEVLEGPCKLLDS